MALEQTTAMPVPKDSTSQRTATAQSVLKDALSAPQKPSAQRAKSHCSSTTANVKRTAPQAVSNQQVECAQLVQRDARSAPLLQPASRVSRATPNSAQHALGARPTAKAATL